MSASLGQTLAGLLNASFGNAVEIIVGIAALLQGLYPVPPVAYAKTNFIQMSCALSRLPCVPMNSIET